MATARPNPGVSEPVSPLVRRVLAANGGPFTGWGTGSMIVGRGTVAVIDPGPDDDAHLAALLAATAGETVSHVVVTHTHRDHSPLARRLAERTGALVAGCAPLAVVDDGPRADSAFDDGYAPDRVLADGDTLTGPGWTLAALATPVTPPTTSPSPCRRSVRCSRAITSWAGRPPSSRRPTAT